MSQEVEVPGVGKLEFPDGMSQSDMAAAIKRNFPQIHKQGVSKAASDMAAEDVGVLDTLAIATGRGFDKTAMGLKQMVLGGVKKFGPESFSKAAEQELNSLAAQEAGKDSEYAGLQAKRPISTGIGEAVPAIMATGGMGLIPASLGVAGMEGMKYGEPEERTKRAVVAGGSNLIGGYIGNKIGDIVAPVAGRALNATQSEALKTAQKLGYKPRLSEVTGSPVMARLEDVAARTPGGAGIMQDFATANQRSLNKAAAKALGENADELTPKVFSAASERISKPFEQIKALPGKSISVGKAVADAADEVLRVQGKMIAAEQDEALAGLAKQAKMLASNSGKIDGETYQLIRSGLSSQSYDATGTNRALYGKLLEALDNSAEESLKAQGRGELAAALREVRPQYGNLKTLEKGAIAEGGNVSAARLASALRTANPKAFREGAMEGNPLFDIAKIGETLKPLKAGSPTYEREAASDVLSMLLKAGPAYAVAKGTTSPMMTAYPNLVATNPTAAALAGPISKTANPSSRALAAALAQRLLVGSQPVAAENQ